MPGDKAGWAPTPTPPLDVLPPGIPATLADDVPAPLTAVAVHGAAKLVYYKVVWWDGRNRHEEWVGAPEVVAAGPPPLAIGFGGP